MENGKWKVENAWKILRFALVSALLVSMFVSAAFAQMQMSVSGKRANNMASNNSANVFLPSKSPLVSMRVQFLTGSADDPQGKEGVAALTAAMLSEGGTKNLPYDRIVEQFYPIAAGFSAQTDKEMTTFVGQTHVDNLEKYYGLIRQMLLEPGFREDDFSRLKLDAINSIKTGLRESNDEELGKERLYNIIYKGTPYENYSTGKVSSLEKLTLQDVKDFYQKNYTRANLVLGLSGGFDDKFSQTIEKDFSTLPAGKKIKRKAVSPNLSSGMKIDIVQRETRSTAISLGFPIDANRASKDYAALALVASYIGQHRSSNSFLYGELREKRGLNYGDYAYVEYFPRGMFRFEPEPNIARTSQIFQIWIRPVQPENANFTLRAALYEYDKLARNGIDQKTFDETRAFLSKYVNILTQTKDDELGYALDSKFYGIPNYNEYMKAQLAKLTLADVNAAIRKHLASDKLRVVMITKDAENLRNQIVNDTPATISYASPKPQAITDEDKTIFTYPIPVKAADITITPVGRVFE